MDNDWKTLRADLPEAVRAHLAAKLNEWRLGKALTSHSGASKPKASPTTIHHPTSHSRAASSTARVRSGSSSAASRLTCQQSGTSRCVPGIRSCNRPAVGWVFTSVARGERLGLAKHFLALPLVKSRPLVGDKLHEWRESRSSKSASAVLRADCVKTNRCAFLVIR